MARWEETVQRLSVYGRVVDGGDARPVAGATVAIVDAPPEFATRADATRAATRADGGFSFSRLPPGRYTLEVTAPRGSRSAPVRCTLDVAESAPAPAGVLRLPSLAVSGRVVVASHEYARLVGASDGLVARWRLGEPSGPAADDVGHHDATVHGVDRGVPGLVAGDADRAVSFDGAAAYLEAPFAPELNPPQVTVEAWVRVAKGSRGGRTVVSSRDNRAKTKFRGYSLAASDRNKWEFAVGDGKGWKVASGGTVAAESTAHVVGTYDGASARVYVDGALVATSPDATLVQNAARPLRIGASSESTPKQFFAGVVDDVSLYARALSAESIAERSSLGTRASVQAAPLAHVSVVGSRETATADTDGRFTLSGLEPGTRVIRAELRGLPPATTSVEVGDGVVAHDAVIVVTPVE